MQCVCESGELGSNDIQRGIQPGSGGVCAQSECGLGGEWVCGTQIDGVLHLRVSLSVVSTDSVQCERSGRWGCGPVYQLLPRPG